jgi:hypothetical protein
MFLPMRFKHNPGFSLPPILPMRFKHNPGFSHPLPIRNIKMLEAYSPIELV